ncbi:hypothetical protein N303_07029, partial [Cuculus canorus]
PDQFQCKPGAPCFCREWLCDGHPGCTSGEDERGCGTATPAELSPEDTRVTPEDGSARSWAPDPECFSACALSSPALLSVLGAVGSVAAWGLSKAKSRSDIWSLEKGSREQLMPGK